MYEINNNRTWWTHGNFPVILQEWQCLASGNFCCVPIFVQPGYVSLWVISRPVNVDDNCFGRPSQNKFSQDPHHGLAGGIGTSYLNPLPQFVCDERPKGLKGFRMLRQDNVNDPQ